MIHTLRFPFSVVLSLTISACSSIDNAEKPISCGKQIQPDDVMILDLRPLEDQPDRIAKFVAEKVGAYQLITTQPIGILIGGPRCGYSNCFEADKAVNGIERIGYARDEAAMRGCNLLLALELKLVPPKRGGNSTPGPRGSANVNRAWVVHLGMRED